MHGEASALAQCRVDPSEHRPRFLLRHMRVDVCKGHRIVKHDTVSTRGAQEHLGRGWLVRLRPILVLSCIIQTRLIPIRFQSPYEPCGIGWLAPYAS